LCLEFDESMNDLIRITCICMWHEDHWPFFIEKINCGYGKRTIGIIINYNKGTWTIK